MSGTDYNLVVAVFFIPYFLFGKQPASILINT